MIIRPDYINTITPFIDTPLVKILAGVRRSGKSTIFEMLVQELKNNGISSDNIIERRKKSEDKQTSPVHTSVAQWSTVWHFCKSKNTETCW